MTNFKKKEKHLRKMLQEQPNNTEIMNKLALTLIQRNRYIEAHKYFLKACSLSPDVQQLTNLAYFYFTEGKPVLEEGEQEYEFEHANQEAIELLEKAVLDNPTFHLPYSLLGWIYMYEEQESKAIEPLLKSVSIKPEIDAFNNLDVCYYRNNQMEKAAFYFEKAYSQDTSSLMPLLNYGICLAKLGEGKKALDIANKLVQLNHKQSEVNFGDIAAIYYTLQQYEEFIETFSLEDIDFLTVDWLPPYFYALNYVGNKETMEQLVENIIKRKEADIQEVLADNDEEWEAGRKEEYIEEEKQDIAYLRTERGKVLKGIRPEIKVELSYGISLCYYFGCEEHGNPSIQEME